MRPNYTDASLVTKYELPASEYEKLDDSVLAWKKANKLGRFDPVSSQVSALKNFLFYRVASVLSVRSQVARELLLQSIWVGVYSRNCLQATWSFYS